MNDLSAEVNAIPVMRPRWHGTVIGLAGALYVSQFVRSLIFEARPSDAAAAPVAAAIFAIIAALASYLPARRALRVEPAITLGAKWG